MESRFRYKLTFVISCSFQLTNICKNYKYIIAFYNINVNASIYIFMLKIC
nr:MAG TPA: hypothetical protein [Caudoviricetes sp.]